MEDLFDSTRGGPEVHIIMAATISAGSVAPTNSTQSLINELVLENAQQHRTATIIVGSFNIVAAVLMMGSILWDTHTTKDDYTNFRSKYISRLPHARTIPF